MLEICKTRIPDPLELCGQCRHCKVDDETCAADLWCKVNNDPEWDYIEEVWVCDDFDGEYDAEAVARSRYEDMLCEQGKNKAKGVSDDIY